MPCSGDAGSTCGNRWLLSLYTYNQTGLASCSGSAAADPVTVGSALPATRLTTATLDASATLSTGTASTASSSTTIVAGLSSTLTNGAVGSATISASASTTIPSSASAVSPSATYATHEDMQDSSEWYSLGCAVDSSDRILTGYTKDGVKNLTIDDCLSLCEDKGYSFAGVEFGVECYCGHSVPTTITYSDSACNVACSGDSTEICGGGWALDLYELISAANASSCAADGTDTTLSAGNVLAIPTIVITSATLALPTLTLQTLLPASATVATTAAGTAATAESTVAADSTADPSSSATHDVWAHHMVGNAYPYAQSDWLSDINAASSYGIDGFALNMGSDSWQPARIADAYSAAGQSGTGFKLFLSLDMTSLSCSSASDAQNLVNLVKTHSTDPSQATHNGKVLVSTFAGSDCTFGTGSVNGWQTAFVDALRSQGVNIFFVPSLFADVSTFASNSWMDGELNWNSGWPSNGDDLTTSLDTLYSMALGGKEYMPAISPFFYTHFGANSWNKNWLYRSDDWLYCTRWEQIIAMRESVKMTEILTWNDYGESSYIGPIRGALPSGSNAWVDGFDHDSINVLTKYYITAFKTGSYPEITEDSIIIWSRPHPHGATASDDSAGQPTGWDRTDDNLYAVVLTKADAIVALTSGSTTQTFSVSAGLTKLKMPSSTGSMSGQIHRSGSLVASYSAGSKFSYTDSPSTYNFNYMVGSSS